MGKVFKMRGDGSREGLKDLITYTEMEGIVMVEIGSYAGESSEIFSGMDQVKTIYCVDPWLGGYDNRDPASKSDMEEIEGLFDQRTTGIEKIIKRKMTGVEASLLFEDKSVDLVYLDGCHKYGAVKKDIEIWLPKVKDTGFISGHDWTWRKVRRAIVETIGKADKTFSDTSWAIQKGNIK